jgi:uncharacterized membrane protein YccC
MKDKLQKVSEALVKTTELLEGGQNEEALAKFKETAELLKEAETEAAATEEATPNAEEVEKTAETLTKVQEELQKYADMFISASNVEDLLADLKSLFTDAITKIAEDMEKKYDAQLEEVNKKLEAPEDSKQVAKSVT